MRIAVINKSNNSCINIIEAESTKIADEVCKISYPYETYCIDNEKLELGIGMTYKKE